MKKQYDFRWSQMGKLGFGTNHHDYSYDRLQFNNNEKIKEYEKYVR